MSAHDQTVLFADVVKSELATADLNRISRVLELLDLIPAGDYTNTWGDALVTVFGSAAEAVRYALNVRDRLRHYDWRQHGVDRPPLLRIGIDCGPIEVKIDAIRGRVPDGAAVVTAARIEPIAEPGTVYVSDRVASLADRGDFFFDDVGTVDLPKKSGKAHVYRAYWARERAAISQQRYGPFLDEQYYRRAEAFRRFAFLWLLLDQLPSGSWGRSTAGWMREVWRDIPHITVHPVKEDEGGFETTLLNLEILAAILGPDKPLTRIGNAVGTAAIDYLEKRHGPAGFGTLGFSRHGYGIDAHTRHTAMAGWFFGHVIRTESLDSPRLRNLFLFSARTLFAGTQDQVSEQFEDDRNPLLLYLAAWHTARELATPEWSSLFGAIKPTVKQMLATWKKTAGRLRTRALAPAYGTNAFPESLLKLRGGPHLDPLTVPYGGYIRMEAYSLLSAAALVHEALDEDVRHRIAAGVKFIVERYLEQWPPEVRYQRHERLQAKPCSPFPYYPIAGFDEVPVSPDLGTAGMLLRILRSRPICSALWGNSEPESFPRARYLLMEDLTQLFDRYLSDPQLFALTHPGMLAGALVDDSQELRDRITERFRPLIVHAPPVAMTNDTIANVLSERRIEYLVDELVADDKAAPKIQMATHSLGRLLLDRLRPGRYLTENLSEEGVRYVTRDTLMAYRNAPFVERYDAIWGDQRDEAILAPFLGLLNPDSLILDVGSGPGQYALGLIQAGHRVALLDASRPFLEVASRRLKDANVSADHIVEGDVLDRAFRLSFHNRRYDAVWCSGLFAHVPQTEWANVLDWIRQLLLPGGALFINVSIGNPRVFARDGRYFQYVHRAADLDSALRRAGFEVSYILKRRIQRNTYREPFVQIEWANFYATRLSDAPAEHPGEMESVLTSLAYSRSVGDFARAHHPDDPAGHAERAKTIEERLEKLGRLLEGIAEPKVLDAGCGLGDYALAMARRGWFAAGLDISERSLERARQNCPDELKPRTLFFFGDMRELPLNWAGEFHAVICVTAMQHIPLMDGEAARVLRGFARVLQPSGILRIDVQLGRGTGFDPDLRFVQGYDDEGVARDLLAEAGFEFIESIYWSVPPGQNSFRRPLKMEFVELWARKK